MKPLDREGRLFGRVNLIDAAVAVFILVLIPLGYAAYAVFRVPTPTITSVEPALLAQSDQTRLRVRIRGTNFLPFLQAYIGRNGEPVASFLEDRQGTQASFLIESPSAAELELPRLRPGTYDVYLYNHADELAHYPAAFRVVEPPPARIETVQVYASVRFVIPPEMASLVKEGDVDHSGTTGTTGPDATLMNVTLRLEPAGSLAAPGGRPWIGPGTTLESQVRIPVTRTESGLWQYKGQRIRAGEILTFGTVRYTMQGLILKVDIPEPSATRLEP